MPSIHHKPSFGAIEVLHQKRLPDGGASVKIRLTDEDAERFDAVGFWEKPPKTWDRLVDVQASFPDGRDQLDIRKWNGRLTPKLRSQKQVNQLDVLFRSVLIAENVREPLLKALHGCVRRWGFWPPKKTSTDS